MRVVIVTGVSGAGKSQAVKTLEDMNFFCVDNLPPMIIPKFLEICKMSEDKIENIAIVMDIRAGKLFENTSSALAAIEDAGYTYEILFLDASNETLIKRYKTTRRRHPLAPNDRIEVGIEREREKLSAIKKRAKYVIDTSNLTPKKLSESLLNIFEYGKIFEELFIGVTSFGFKNGVPNDVDLVFDARFLPNPYHVDELREFTGKDERIKSYVMSFPETSILLDKIMDYLEFVIPQYIKEGRIQLIVGIGCTGGKHRSVVLAEEITKRLQENGHRAKISHRDIGKE